MTEKKLSFNCFKKVGKKTGIFFFCKYIQINIFLPPFIITQTVIGETEK